MPFALVLVPVFFFLPGLVFARLFQSRPDELSPGERVFLPIAVSVCLTTWLALTLAELGAYSLATLAALVLLLVLAGWLVTRRRAGARIGSLRPDPIFLAILALAIFLFARPAEYVIGNSDAGTYVNTGASIARTGGIAIHDAQVAQLPPGSANTFYWALTNPFMLYRQVRLPGFFIADPSQGLVLPQFLHLYPAWLAVWDSLAGVELGLYATPLIALLGSSAFYLLARELAGRRTALLAFFLLVVTVPQFWFARYPVAEALTQFLALSGLYALLKATRSPAPGWPLLAGIALGEIFFTRADAVLLLVPLAALALVLLLTRRWSRGAWLGAGAFGVVFVHALVHMLVFAPNYLYFQYSHALRMKNIDKLFGGLPDAGALFSRWEYLFLAVLPVLAGIAGLFLFDRLFHGIRRRWGAEITAGLARAKPALRLLGAALIVVLILGAYFVWPRPESLYAYVGGATPLDRSANLIKLGWYLSPVGVLLALLGGVIVVWRDLNARNALWYGTAALFAVFYLEELYSNPHYIYTTRHYIPLVIPLFLLLAARALQWLWQLGSDRGARSSDRAGSPFPRVFTTPARPAGLGAIARPVALRTTARPIALGRIARPAALILFAGWMLYNLYAMGIIEASRASGIALRLPLVGQTMTAGLVRLEPFEDSIAGFAELGGAYSQLARLAGTLDPRAVIIFAAGRDEPAAVATPLTYIFGRDAFVTVFNNPPAAKVAALVDGWRAQGREVILAYGTNGGKLQLPGYALERAGDFALDVPQWAFSYTFMPRGAWRVNLNYVLYRAVPDTVPASWPFVLDFGGDDFPHLVRGFLERAPEASTRWIGTVVPEGQSGADWKWQSGTVVVPRAADTRLRLTVTARAPRPGVRFQVKSNQKVLGSATLDESFSEHTFELDPAALEPTAGGYLLELVSQATPDGQGRVLGAELARLRIEPLAP